MHLLVSTFEHLDIPALVQSVGYFGIFLIAFAESGVVVGLFLPGDSMLFVSGLLAAHGYLTIWILLPLYMAAGFLGDMAGYWFGYFLGIKLFTDDARFFKKHYIDITREFYEKYGPRAVVLARFVPIVRTLTPILAGAGSMRYRQFLMWNAIGAVLWGAGMTLLGYILGDLFPQTELYILPIVVLVIVLSVLPGVIEFVRNHLKQKL